MKRDLKQLIGPGKVTGNIVKLGICVTNDSDVYPSCGKIFTINDKEMHFNKDGVYEISVENDENIKISSFSIQEGCIADYVIKE